MATAMLAKPRPTPRPQRRRAPGYGGSGWTALRAQYVRQERPGDRPTNKTWQAVVSFPLPVDTEAFFSKQVASRPTCDGRRINLRPLDEP